MFYSFAVLASVFLTLGAGHPIPLAARMHIERAAFLGSLGEQVAPSFASSPADSKAQRDSATTIVPEGHQSSTSETLRPSSFTESSPGLETESVIPTGSPALRSSGPRAQATTHESSAVAGSATSTFDSGGSSSPSAVVSTHTPSDSRYVVQVEYFSAAGVDSTETTRLIGLLEFENKTKVDVSIAMAPQVVDLYTRDKKSLTVGLEAKTGLLQFQFKNDTSRWHSNHIEKPHLCNTTYFTEKSYYNVECFLA